MSTVVKWLAEAAKELKASGIASSLLDAELILGHVMKHDRAWLKAHDDADISSVELQTVDRLLERRSNREPLVHLTNTREFYGIDLEITSSVLTPRVETEQMVEWAIKHAPEGVNVIDIGTGSGAIAIAVALARPDLVVTATEITHEALAVAKRNALRHKVDIQFILSDLWEDVGGSYDVILTNLPYLRDDARADLMPEVRHEPDIALFGGNDGLGLYRKFLAGLPAYLAPHGLLFTESDPWQHEALILEAKNYGLEPIEQGYFIIGFKHDII